MLVTQRMRGVEGVEISYSYFLLLPLFGNEICYSVPDLTCSIQSVLAFQELSDPADCQAKIVHLPAMP
jgi:hypothetical protein